MAAARPQRLAGGRTRGTAAEARGSGRTSGVALRRRWLVVSSDRGAVERGQRAKEDDGNTNFPPPPNPTAYMLRHPVAAPVGLRRGAALRRPPAASFMASELGGGRRAWSRGRHPPRPPLRPTSVDGRGVGGGDVGGEVDSDTDAALGAAGAPACPRHRRPHHSRPRRPRASSPSFVPLPPLSPPLHLFPPIPNPAAAADTPTCRRAEGKAARGGVGGGGGELHRLRRVPLCPAHEAGSEPRRACRLLGILHRRRRRRHQQWREPEQQQQPADPPSPRAPRAGTTPGPSPRRQVMAETAAVGTVEEPLLVSAIEGEEGRETAGLAYEAAGRGSNLLAIVIVFQSYQLLCERHPSFCERSELVDLVVEISLQPWKVFTANGAILFSDILTPLPRMNIPFDIVKGKGPVIFDPLRTAAAVNEVREFVPEEWVPYVGQALNILREEINNEATVLSFVGAPFTLASYCVEGGSSKNFSKIKKMALSEPEIVDSVKETHPELPLILYASGSGGLLERLPLTGVDVVSLGTVDMAEGRKRLGSNIAVQGNVDPGVLFGSKEFISNRIFHTAESW
uniref:Uroporphyrinogen decarboxylase (URO-D) domain-containing protein n=1 Tax=Oryza nivara TaxID=4536 RepID=A0A0E0GM62_ORYNI